MRQGKKLQKTGMYGVIHEDFAQLFNATSSSAAFQPAIFKNRTLPQPEPTPASR